MPPYPTQHQAATEQGSTPGRRRTLPAAPHGEHRQPAAASRRHSAVALLVVLGMLGLSGCQQPLPGVTLAGDAGSVRVEASSWCPNADDDRTCVQRTQTAPTTLPVRPGGWIGIGVDVDVAERGWRLLLDGQPQPPHPPGYTYHRLEARHLLPGERKHIEVQALDGTGRTDRITGSWTVHVTP